MFGRSRARRREAHRVKTLTWFDTAGADEREDFAYRLILERDTDLALYLLLDMLDTEAEPAVRAELTESLVTVLRNARSLLVEVEDDVLKAGADSPRTLLRTWNTWRSTVASRLNQTYQQPSWQDLTALHEDLQHQQRCLTRAGVIPPPSADGGREQPADVSDIAGAVVDIAATLARHTTRSDWDAEARGAAVREKLAQAGRSEPHSDERAELLLGLLPDEDEFRWTDQREVDLAMAEALSYADSDPLLTAHAVVTLLSSQHQVRVPEVRAVLDKLTAAPDTDAHTMSWALVAYEALALNNRLEDFSHAWFQDLLSHPEPQVRETVITVIGELPCSGEEEAATVRKLVRVVEDAEERDSVRAAAAHTLGALSPDERDLVSAIGRALGDHAWDDVAELRVEYLRYVLSRHDDSALPDLLDELAKDDVSLAHVSLISELTCAPSTRCTERDWWDHVDHYVHAGQALVHLTTLADHDWPTLPDDQHTTQERASALSLATATLRSALGEAA